MRRRVQVSISGKADALLFLPQSQAHRTARGVCDSGLLRQSTRTHGGGGGGNDDDDDDDDGNDDDQPHHILPLVGCGGGS